MKVVIKANNFKSTLRQINKAVDEAIEVVCEYGAERAKIYVPVDTARLYYSIGSDETRFGVGIGTGDVPEYAEFVEYGTSRMGAQPYMLPAEMDVIEEGPGMIERVVKKSVS